MVRPARLPNQFEAAAHAFTHRVPAPQTSSGHQISPSRYSTPGRAVASQEGRAVEVDDVAELAEMKAGAMARLVPTMLPTITPGPAGALSAISSAFGQAAALVELDVDHVEAVRVPTSAQSSALRAPPGGRMPRNSSRVMPASMRSRRPSSVRSMSVGSSRR
jgi:hypothetical protein